MTDPSATESTLVANGKQRPYDARTLLYVARTIKRKAVTLRELSFASDCEELKMRAIELEKWAEYFSERVTK